MASALPSAKDLGVVQVQPSLGVAQRRGATGYEDAVASGIDQAAGHFSGAAAYLDKAQDENDRMAAEDALNKYRSDLLKRQYDEREGWQTQLGQAATDANTIKGHLDYMQSSRDQIGGTLSQRAKKYFQPQAEASRMHSEASFYGHVAQQRTQQEIKIFEAGQQLIVDGVSRNPLGPAGDELMNAAIQEARSKSETFALRRGFSPEETTNLSNAAITAIVAARVSGALNADRPDEAKRVYDENSKLLGQKGREMEGRVNDAFLKWSTFRLADEEVNKIVAKVERANAEKGIPAGGAPEQPAPYNPVDFGFGNVQSGGGSTAKITQAVAAGLPDPRRVQFTPGQTAAITAASAGDPAKASFLRNVVAVENAGFGVVRTDAVSPAGAAGGFQFIPATARKFGLAEGERGDFQKAAGAASKYYDELYARYKGNRLAMAADYNGGPAAGEAVMRGKAPPALETQKYLVMFAQAEGGNALRSFENTGVTFQTSRVKDLQEELRTLDENITTAFRAKFGDSNPEGLELARQRARSRLQAKIGEENGIQQGNLNEITTTVINNNIDNFRDLQLVPGMADKLRTAGPYIQHIVSLMNMVGHQKTGAAAKGDVATYVRLTQEVINGKIQTDKDLLPYLMDPTRPGSVGIDTVQLAHLQQQISRTQNPDTKQHDQVLHFMQQNAARQFAGIAASKGLYHIMPGDAGERVIADALMQWNIDARRQVREAEKAGTLNKLFDQASAEYLVSPKNLERFVVAAKDAIAPTEKTVPPTPAEIKALPVVKGKNHAADTTYLKLKSAVMTPEGWQGGYFKTPDGKVHQKKPAATTAGVTGG